MLTSPANIDNKFAYGKLALNWISLSFINNFYPFWFWLISKVGIHENQGNFISLWRNVPLDVLNPEVMVTFVNASKEHALVYPFIEWDRDEGEQEDEVNCGCNHPDRLGNWPFFRVLLSKNQFIIEMVEWSSCLAHVEPKHFPLQKYRNILTNEMVRGKAGTNAHCDVGNQSLGYFPHG